MPRLRRISNRNPHMVQAFCADPLPLVAEPVAKLGNRLWDQAVWWMGQVAMAMVKGLVRPDCRSGRMRPMPMGAPPALRR